MVIIEIPRLALALLLRQAIRYSGVRLLGIEFHTLALFRNINIVRVLKLKSLLMSSNGKVQSWLNLTGQVVDVNVEDKDPVQGLNLQIIPH